MPENKNEKLSSMRMKKKRESSENLQRELKNALHAQQQKTDSDDDSIDRQINQCNPWFELVPEDDPEATPGVFKIRGRLYQYASTSSLLFLGNKSKFRRFFLSLVTHTHFNSLFIALVFLSTIVLCLFDYKDRNCEHKWNRILMKICNFLTCFFIFEAISKMVAFGLFFG